MGMTVDAITVGGDHIVLLGVKGGPAIRPGSQMPTAQLVVLGGQRIVVDAGLGVTRALCDQGVHLATLQTIVITHLHSDHYLELGPLLHTAWTAGLKTPVTVYGPAGLGRYWQAFLDAMRDDIALRIVDEGRIDLAGLVQIRVLDAARDVDLGDVCMRVMRNDHPPLVDSFALRFDGGGGTLCLSGDTAYLPALAEFARGVDLLVHEAMLPSGVDALVAATGNGDDRLRQHLLRSHTAADDVGRIAQDAGVGCLALTHFVPDGLAGFTDDDWIALTRKTWGGPLIIGKDGLRVGLKRPNTTLSEQGNGGA
ncbi:Ribonuclease BN, tRNA processing enzyme [Loktanella sp. DSM 29012]|uniref:MBL fold metallo-hydrolase n=1 Tax=Loktanella sp. DSM 29012 TaxID=1881056 RepID=UPI0008B52D8D|nr:MBL fold metallo-hydrolase [Loktanella sp. DSM 29012]SEP72334.1 Ribonuclease BN, tRNA processing enzyme [Loktanella sp. DSM 29012]